MLCASTFLRVAGAVLDPLGLLCSAVNSGLAHLSKLSGFLFPAWPKLLFATLARGRWKGTNGQKMRKSWKVWRMRDVRKTNDKREGMPKSEIMGLVRNNGQQVDMIRKGSEINKGRE